jgi:hypothetical protein
MKKLFLLSLSSCLGLTAMAQYSVTTGGQKYVVVEDVTGAWCQYCPDGTVVQEQVLAAHPRAIGIALHNNDKMSFSDGNSVMASPNLVCGYPGGLINRKNWNGAYASTGCLALTAAGRNVWDQLTGQETATTPKWDVSMTHSFNPTTRVLTVNITGKALGAQTGKHNFNVWVVEDSVVGPDVTGYNQVNFYNTQSGHPYYQKGSSIKFFEHRHVARAYLGGAWGTTGKIPANAPNNGTYTHTYTYTIPAKYDATTAGAPETRLNQISLIGMVMRDTTSKYDREIMNAVEARMMQFPTGIANVPAVHQLTVFPNPAQDRVTVKGILNNPGAVKVSIVNSVGQTVLENNYNYTSSLFGEVISIDKLSNGVYFMNLSADGGTTTEKIIVKR